MVERVKLKKRRYLYPLIISLFLFSFGFLLGYWTVDAKVNYLVDSSSDLKLESFDFDVQTALIDIYPCDHFTTANLESSLTLMEKDIEKVEDSASSDNERLIFMKNYYSLLEMKHWLFLSKFSDVCDQNYTFAFFFYSNDDTYCADCEVQGYVLETLREQTDDLKVYSFDDRVDVHSVNIIKRKYNITTVPSLVINDQVYFGYVSYEDLKSQLESEGVIFDM